jgi:DNA-binding NarL/FixJ family response regulator
MNRRITIEFVLAAAGVVLVVCALAANQSWLDRHFLPSFVIDRVQYVRIETAIRIASATIGLALAIVARRRLAAAFARDPMLVVSSAAAILLALAASELALRHLHVPPAEWLFHEEEPRRQADSRLAWTLVPSRIGRLTIGGRAIEYVIDARGCRARRPDDFVDPSKPTIVFAGESVIFGEGLTFDETIAAQVTAITGLQSANLGVNGYSNDQAFLRLQQELPRFAHPVVVVSLFMPVLFGRNLDDDRPHLGPGLTWQPAAHHARLVSLARLFVPYRTEDEIARGVTLTRNVLRATADLARARGAIPVLVVPQVGVEDPVETALRHRVLDEGGIPYTPVSIDERWTIGPSDRHPDARGARAIAETIAGTLRIWQRRGGRDAPANRHDPDFRLSEPASPVYAAASPGADDLPVNDVRATTSRVRRAQPAEPDLDCHFGVTITQPGPDGVTVNYSVLVVDDYEPWRRRVAAELEKSSRWRVVSECADGGDAVREASARKPDLVVLDIGLKTMNGVEAARRIIAADPNARILFLTGQHSPDVAEVALATGARGYLLKPEAGGALLRAVEAVFAGARFISPGLPPEVVSAPAPPARRHRHNAVFRQDDAGIVDEYARFAEEALERGRPFIIVAPRTSLEGVHARLEARGVSIDRAIDTKRYQAYDVHPELTRLMPGGRYDRERVRQSAETLLADATRRAPQGECASVCGEIAPQLWREGRGDVAIDVERLWDEAVTAAGADLLCAYCVDRSRLADGAYSVFREICGAHGTVLVR